MSLIEPLLSEARCSRFVDVQVRYIPAAELPWIAGQVQDVAPER